MQQRDTKELHSFLQKKIKEHNFPGVAVAVHGPDGLTFEKGYGYRDLDKKTAPDADTIFGIASMGKSMAALCCCILAAEGRISLDDPSAIWGCTPPEFRPWSLWSGPLR